jgi:methionyl-tRNA formyltransferase
MNIAVIGSSSLGVTVAKALLSDGHTIVGVCAPEGDKLRKWAFETAPVYDVREPDDFRVTDIAVAAHNLQYVPADTVRACGVGVLSYHPSLLPRHRGKNSVQDTIDAHDAIAGGTVYWLDEGYDTGPIAAQEWCHVVPGWTASDLWREELFAMGVRLIRSTVREVEAGNVVAIKQDERVATGG